MYKFQIGIICLFIQFTLSAQFYEIDYGQTKNQIEILNLNCLHERGFTGKGVTIAHLDDGFDGFDEMDVFRYSREKGLLKASFDFVHNGKLEMKGNGSHGTNTLSVVNGFIPGEYVGTAFDANIVLAHTEDNRTETHQEELNWKKAVDWCVEKKVDIIASSLQYNTFDKGEGDYSYKDMNGRTTIITKAADYAASKGILVVAIQGNFGSQKWHYVTAPGDADSVLTVGAMNTSGIKAGFSSFGPTSDGRIKPDVMAVGEATIIVDPNGKIRPGNGTSFAGPAIAGLAACLKQAHPERNNMELITAIRQSASKYENPDKVKGYGYGTPDACRADEILSDLDYAIVNWGKRIERETFAYKMSKNKLYIYPKFSRKDIKKVELCNVLEQTVCAQKGKKKKMRLKRLKSGNYVLKIHLKNGKRLVENVVVK